MSAVEFRPAVADDLPAIVAMLADNALGATRESPDDLRPYQRAFAAVDADPNQHLVAAVCNGVVVGTMQLTLIPACPARALPSRRS